MIEISSCVQEWINERNRGYKYVHQGEQSNKIGLKIVGYQIIKHAEDEIEKYRMSYELWLANGGKWPPKEKAIKHQICKRYQVNPRKSLGVYDKGIKRCGKCEVFMKFDGVRCPCCNIVLKTHPVSNTRKYGYVDKGKRI